MSSAPTRRELVSSAPTRRDLQIVTPGEESQAQKQKHCRTPLM